MTEQKIFNYAINDGFFWSEVNLKGEKKYYVEGYASTIDEDKAGEILDFSAQQDIHQQIQHENITMDIEHEEWYDSNGKLLARPRNEKIPVAKIIASELRPRGVWVKAELNTNLRSFKEVWGSIKDGFLKAFSVAFYPIQRNGNVVKHLNLVNITLTGSPVNPLATFEACMKSAAAWMDSVDAKAEYKPELTNPADNVPLTNPADSMPLSNPADKYPVEKKSEESPMVECKECGKEFPDKEALEEHQEEKHSKKEEKGEAEVKSEPAVESVESVVKAMREKQEAEMAALREEVATLKAELAKPMMKAIVEKTTPVEVKTAEPVSPLRLVR